MVQERYGDVDRNVEVGVVIKLVKVDSNMVMLRGNLVR